MDAIDRSRRGRHSPALRSNVFTETRCERCRGRGDGPSETSVLGGRFRSVRSSVAGRVAARRSSTRSSGVSQDGPASASRVRGCSFRPEGTEFGPRPLWVGADRLPDHQAAQAAGGLRPNEGPPWPEGPLSSSRLGSRTMAEARLGIPHLLHLRTPAPPLRRLPQHDVLRAVVRGVPGEPDGPSAKGSGGCSRHAVQ